MNARVSVLAVMIVAMAASQARAHEKGVITLASGMAAAGSTLQVMGEKFSSSTQLRLVLRGALSEREIGSAETDAAGGFVIELEIPAGVEPGAYRLVAVAPDGDEVASADLEVEAAPAVVPESAGAGAQEQAAGAAGAEPAASAMPIPSAEELAIERRWSGFEWFVIGVLVGGATVAGMFLYRRPAFAT